MKSPLAYVGGKNLLSKTIIGLIPEHRTYCEVFCGAAWVFFRKEPTRYEIINDLDREAIESGMELALNRIYRKGIQEGVLAAIGLLAYLNALGKDMEFAGELIRYRKMGLTQREAGKLLDIGRTTVQKIERALKGCGCELPVSRPARMQLPLPLGKGAGL